MDKPVYGLKWTINSCYPEMVSVASRKTRFDGYNKSCKLQATTFKLPK